MDVGRWRPLGKKTMCLIAAPCQLPDVRDYGECACMESITVDQVKEIVMRWSSEFSQPTI